MADQEFNISEWEQILSKLEDRIEKEREKYNQQLREKDREKRILSDFVAEKDVEIKHLRDKLQADSVESKNEFDKRIKELQIELENKERILNEGIANRDSETVVLRDELRKRRNELWEAEQKFKEAQVKIEAQHAEERAQLESKIVSFRQQVDDLKTQITQQEIKLRSDAQESERRSVTGLQEKYESIIQELKQQLVEEKKAFDQMFAEKEKEISGVKAESLKHEKEMALAAEELRHQMTQTRLGLEEQLNTLERKSNEDKMLFDGKVTLLESKIDDLTKERDEWINKTREQQGKIESLESQVYESNNKVELVRKTMEDKVFEKEKQISELQVEISKRDAELRNLSEKEENERSRVKKTLTEKLLKFESTTLAQEGYVSNDVPVTQVSSAENVPYTTEKQVSEETKGIVASIPADIVQDKKDTQVVPAEDTKNIDEKRRWFWKERKLK
ncbi:MAG: hypothetical protein WC955_10405 [Elusimicrobiota bacterium]